VVAQFQKEDDELSFCIECLMASLRKNKIFKLQVSWRPLQCITREPEVLRRPQHARKPPVYLLKGFLEGNQIGNGQVVNKFTDSHVGYLRYYCSAQVYQVRFLLITLHTDITEQPYVVQVGY